MRTPLFDLLPWLHARETNPAAALAFCVPVLREARDSFKPLVYGCCTKGGLDLKPSVDRGPNQPIAFNRQWDSGGDGGLELEEIDHDVDAVDQDATGSDLNLAPHFAAAHQRYTELGDVEKAEAMRMERNAFALEPMKGKVRFRVGKACTTATGAMVPVPDIDQDFDNTAIAHYRTRAISVPNPMLRARYSDIAWQFAEDRNRDDALRATQAYLEIAESQAQRGVSAGLMDSLDRALDLAVALNDRAQIQGVVGTTLTLLESLADRGIFGHFDEMATPLISHYDHIAKRDPFPFHQLEDVLERARTHFNHPMFADNKGRLTGLLETLYRLQDDADKANAYALERAQDWEKQAEYFEAATIQMHNFLAAVAYLQASAAYMVAGNHPDKVQECKQKSRAAQEEAIRSDFGKLPYVFQQDTADLQAWLDSYKALPVEEALARLATDAATTVSFDDQVTAADLMKSQAPALFRIPVPVLRRGISVTTFVEPDDIFNFRVLEALLLQYHLISATQLSPLFDLLTETHPGIAEGILDFLRTRKWLREDRVELIEPGLMAFLARDWKSALPVLVPQFEGGLRDYAESLGVATVAQEGLETRDRSLGEVIQRLLADGRMDRDFLLFVDVLFSKIEHGNLRNDIAHGLLPATGFNRENANLVMLALINLACQPSR